MGSGSNGSGINGSSGHSIDGAVSDVGPDMAIDLQLGYCRGHDYRDPCLVGAWYAVSVRGLKRGGAEP